MFESLLLSEEYNQANHFGRYCFFRRSAGNTTFSVLYEASERALKFKFHRMKTMPNAVEEVCNLNEDATVSYPTDVTAGGHPEL